MLNWPPELRAEETGAATRFGYDLLAFIDTLALGYDYGVKEDRPVMHFSVDWTPGAYGVFDNEKVPYDEMPDGLRIVAVDLSAAVYVDDAPVATLSLWLDSLALAPLPEQFFFELDERAWDGVFAGASAAETQSYFDDGFTLRDLHIDRVAFAAYEDQEDEPAREPPFDPSYPTTIGVYPPHVGIFVDWLIRPGDRGAGKRGRSVATTRRAPREGVGRTVPSEARRPRTRGGRQTQEGDSEAARTARTATGDRDAVTAEREQSRSGKRSGASGKKGKSDDDDDDDDEQLLPAALIGVAAVGIVAYAAGTVGYYGNTETPIGLTAGYAQPGGGVLLQAAVNSAVLGSDEGPERLLAKVVGFHGVARIPLQPAVGFGIFAEEHGDDIDLTPTLSLGAVANFGPLLLFGGYDFAAAGADFGIAVNFRSRRQTRR